jgi:hypothetical protein
MTTISSFRSTAGALEVWFADVVVMAFSSD